MKTKILICMLVSMVTSITFAQQPTLAHKPMSKEDSTALNALVMYPDTIRLDIFEACMYPAVIVNIATLQKNSSSEFTNIIATYSKDEQEDFYNLSRYPGLISNLVQGGKKSKEQINTILVNYPGEIHASALSYASSHFEVLQKIDNLQFQTNAQFEQIISDYPPTTKEAFRELIQLPEVINILNDHLEFTVRVGDRYKRDPQRVIHKADSANLAETRQHAEDVAAWKQSLKDNPDDAADLKNAGNEYAQENGYSQDEINTAPNPDYVSNYTVYPYSYWFGYPMWYPYSYWYPYPFWFDCGYYYDPYGNMIVIGMPSFYFTNWYFYYPEHWHHYPHLGNHYVNQYYGHRDSHTGNSQVVHRWVKENRDYLPKDFVENKTKRVESIKQVGQMHGDAQKKIGGKPITTEQKDQYFQKNVSKYPELNNSKQPNRVNEDKQQSMPDYYKEQPTKQPPVRINKQEQQQAPVPKQNPTPPAYQFNNINKAQDYHRNSWDQSQPKQQPQQIPRAQPAPQQTPRQQPAPQPPRQAPSNPGGSPKRK